MADLERVRELAARGASVVGGAALEWLSERTRARPTDWARGVKARVRALLSQGADADSRSRESITHLSRTRLRAELARTHLLYG